VVAVLKVLRKKRRKEEALLRQVHDLNNVWQISDIEIELTDRIGHGACGEVFRATYRDMTVAVKLLKSREDDDRLKYEFEREIQFMQTVRHPNIILFIGAGRFPNNTPFIVIEFLENGSLRDLLDEDRQISNEQKIGFWVGVAKGMRFLHTLDPPRIHRDLKCGNLLLSRNFTVKIADFGLGREVEYRRRRPPEHTAKVLSNEHEIMTVLGIGTPRWCAPELSARMKYSTAVDVYRYFNAIYQLRCKTVCIFEFCSFGIVMWEIWTQQLPYDQYRFNYQVEDAVAQGERPETPVDCPKEYYQLMADCWQHDPSCRPSFEEICQRIQYF
jgi:serine/threonine protein kinase